MDQEKMEILAAGGIDAADALDRMMGSEALLVRFLGRFLEDATYQALCQAVEAGGLSHTLTEEEVRRLCQAVEAGDWEKALMASHTLKGMCGNLSMTELYDLFTRQVALLRAGQPAEAAALMPAIEAAYGRAADAIGRLTAV